MNFSRFPSNVLLQVRPLLQGKGVAFESALDLQRNIRLNSTNKCMLSTKTEPEDSAGPKFGLSQTTRVLYDGECKLCKVEITGLKWLARDKPGVEFIDITSPHYQPSLVSGVTYEQAMKEMHVVGPKGQIYTQGDAIRQMYRASGLGWLASLTELPGIKDVCDKMYIRFAHYRLQKALARCDSESDRCSIKLHNLKEKMKDSS